MPARLVSCLLLVGVSPLLGRAQCGDQNAKPFLVVSSDPVQPPAADRILAAMRQYEDWDTTGWMIDDLVREMQKRLGCTVTVDERTLHEQNRSSDIRIPGWKMHKVRRGAFLRQLLSEVDLTWVVRHGRVEITTREVEDSKENLFVYPVADLVSMPGLGREGYDLDTLSELITTMVAPDRWHEGGHDVEYFGASLVLTQTGEVGEMIGGLIETLRKVKKRETDRNSVKQVSYGLASDGRQRPDLHQRISISKGNTPLGEAVRELARITKLNVRFDMRVLRDWQIDAQQSVELDAENEPLSSVLQRLTEPIELAWTYQHDMLVITVPEALPLIIRVYPVHDLVADERIAFQPRVLNPLSLGIGVFPHDSLIETITGLVDIDSWENAGGPGSIEGFERPDVLVVSQRLQVHEQIEGLLAALRGAKELERQVMHVDAEKPSTPPSTRLLRVRLAKGVPARKTARLLRELYPDCPMVRVFGQGLLVRDNEGNLTAMFDTLSRLEVLDVNGTVDGRKPLMDPDGR